MRKFKFEKIDSTNDYLKNKKDKENFDLVIAKEQIAGRGRRGNQWKSETGAALFSFAVKKNDQLKFEEYRKLPLITGLAVLNSLKEISKLDYKFKWTNDVYINNKKISGLLIEFIDDYFIIGIGINVNNKGFKELSNKATSLILETKKEYNIDEVIENTLNEFKYLYSRFLRGEWEEIKSEINNLNYLKDKKIVIEHMKNTIKGTAKNIVDDGMLEVELENGKIKKFDVGEVHIEL